MCVVVALSASSGAAQTGRDIWKDCQVSEGDVAVRACTAVIESDLENGARLAIALDNRGNAYLATGHNDDAIHDYDEAVRLQPHLASAFINRGVAYLAKGECVRAILDYDEAIGLKSGNTVAFYDRGVANLCLGQNDRASLKQVTR